MQRQYRTAHRKGVALEGMQYLDGVDIVGHDCQYAVYHHDISFAIPPDARVPVWKRTLMLPSFRQ
eukprot:2948563-Rhodomonas_salina.1